MTTRHVSHRLRRAAALTGEFVFVAGAFFAVLGIAVMILGGPGPLRNAGGVAFFAFVLVVSALHHRWYSRHRREIESGRDQKAIRERRGY